MWPLLVTNTDTMRTVQIGIVMLPTLLLFTLGQKYILSGALAGAVKG